MTANKYGLTVENMKKLEYVTQFNTARKIQELKDNGYSYVAFLDIDISNISIIKGFKSKEAARAFYNDYQNTSLYFISGDETNLEKRKKELNYSSIDFLIEVKPFLKNIFEDIKQTISQEELKSAAKQQVNNMFLSNDKVEIQSQKSKTNKL